MTGIAASMSTLATARRSRDSSADVLAGKLYTEF
jgi:hypothetical protein